MPNDSVHRWHWSHRARRLHNIGGQAVSHDTFIRHTGHLQKSDFDYFGTKCVVVDFEVVLSNTELKSRLWLLQ